MFRWFQLARRVSELEDSMVKLTRIVEARDLDWDDMRARVRRLLDRTQKAADRIEKHDQPEEPIPIPSGEDVESALGGRLLTPRQKQIQQSILHRRARLPQRMNGGE